MSDENNVPDQITIYEDIKERVNKRYEWRTQLAGHIVGYIAFLIAGSFLVSDGSFFNGSTFGLIAAVWFGGLMIHMVNVVLAELRERTLHNELKRAGIYPSILSYEKSKRDDRYNGSERLVRLTEEGELVDVNHFDDEQDQEQQQAQ